MMEPTVWVMQLAVLAALALCPLARRGRGRHVSRPIGRATWRGPHGVHWIQTAWICAAFVTVVPLVFGDRAVLPVSLVMYAAAAAWLIDDALTGGNDKPGRKHEWARPKLRMPKPVRLRPAERVPAPVPA